MARSESTTLTDGELRLMKVLWEVGEGTVVAVQRALPERLEESTIRTLLGILERKGYVSRRKEGRAFLYRTRTDRESTQRSAVRHLAARFFGDPTELLLSILRSEKIDRRELERIKAEIDELERT